MRLMEGVNNIGKANKTNIIAITVMILMDFGRCINAILICVFECLRHPS